MGPGVDPGEGVVDLGDLTGRGATDPARLVDLVRQEGAGAARVQAVHAVEDAATAWAAARAGLRREGVLRGVPGPSGVRDLAVVARVAGDPDPDVDALPAIVPLFPVSLVSAGVVLRDGAGRVLLLRTSYKVPWEVPGGVLEDGEGLRAGAAREAREELGLDLSPGRLLVLDRRGGDDRQPERLLALLDGGVHDEDLPARCRFLDGEVLEAVWCDRAEVRARTGPGLATRVEAALDRLASGDPSTALLADGAPEA
ncbi:NUDIX domain-containing protein [Pseudokineococcus marinus]|uniref:NUDIX domain-containing protein n=1 Tax=Pseudokineococcus marinus TaxID=351215 RepID=UPI001488852A|nr:NUDIX hydrolase [Pseudokineococcus marinus]